MFQGRNGVANANFREREEPEYEEVQVEETGHATRRLTNSLEKPTSSAKIGVKIILENKEDGDIINHTYVNTEFGSIGFIERSLREEISENMKGVVMNTNTEKMIVKQIKLKNLRIPQRPADIGLQSLRMVWILCPITHLKILWSDLTVLML